MDAATINKFNIALPTITKWIEDLLLQHQNDAVKVSRLGFQKLTKYFPSGLLEETKTVKISKIPFPPVEQIGISELSEMAKMQIDGITYKNTFFIRDNQPEDIFFHELIHIVQWKTLGVNNFLLAYGAGILQFGYRNSPLEQMAYNLQESFMENRVPLNLIEQIQKQTDNIWLQIAPLIGKK